MSYKNPSNYAEILAELKGYTRDENDKVFALLDRTFPGWIVKRSRKYGSGYTRYNNTWKEICDKLHVEPKEVLIVRKIVFPNQTANSTLVVLTEDANEYTLLTDFCNILTARGYAVRRVEEFVLCAKCGDAIPTEDMYEFLKLKNQNVPRKYSKKCLCC